MSTHRFPKWLMAETFTIEHDAKFPGRFVVKLKDTKSAIPSGYVGYGPTIGAAAKHASQVRARANEK